MGSSAIGDLGMGFNLELAKQIAFEDTDRDTARFFAGREREMRDFQYALNAAQRSKPAIFRIYQGAPGCGKSSLATHLAQQHKEDALCVEVDHGSVESRNGIMTNAIEAARSKQTSVGQAAVPIFQALLERKLTKTLSEQTRGAYEQFLAKRQCIVFHLDEAQVIGEAGCKTLLRLHTKGLGETEAIPCVVLLTGLAHTKEWITSFSGLSRLAEGATLNVSAMSAVECAESTLQMLDKLRVEDARHPSKSLLAEQAANWSVCWPMHLHSAQKAICEALIRTGGDLRDVDPVTIERRTAELRGAYYEERLKAVNPYDHHPHALRRVVHAIRKKALPAFKDHLALLCLEEINKEALIEKTVDDGLALAKAFIEKGIVESTEAGWALSIPSMAAWAERKLDETREPR